MSKHETVFAICKKGASLSDKEGWVAYKTSWSTSYSWFKMTSRIHCTGFYAGSEQYYFNQCKKFFPNIELELVEIDTEKCRCARKWGKEI